MNVKATKKIGDTTLEIIVEGESTLEAIGRSIFLTEPDVCGQCGKTDIEWRYNKAQDKFDYVKRICKACKYESNISETKGTHVYYWNKWVPGYQGQSVPVQESTPSPVQEPMPTPSDEIVTQDIPF